MGLYPHCTIRVTIKVQFYNSTFLPHGHLLADSVSQPESSKSPKVKIMLEINIRQILGMLDLLNKSWPCQQLLVAWYVPNNHTNVLFTQKRTIQCLPPHVVIQQQSEK